MGVSSIMQLEVRRGSCAKILHALITGPFWLTVF